MAQFWFPGNIDFAADDQGALSCCIHEADHEGLMCLFIVCETMFTIGESRAISHANDTEQQAQQVAANSRLGGFSTEPPLECEYGAFLRTKYRHVITSIMSCEHTSLLY